ncbi:MAG: nuclear transport factor 2 family protein [Sphingorhabdus sp.]
MIAPGTTRRAVLGGIASGLAFNSVGVAARNDRPAGPLATRNRELLFRRFAIYLSLVDKGDPGQRGYLATGAQISLPAHLQCTTLRTVALDDGGALLAAEIKINRSGGSDTPEPEFDLQFYRIANGYITEIISVANGAQLTRGESAAVTRPPKPAAGPLPDTVASRHMTRAKFQDYLKLFGQFDERFVFFYADDVVFTALPAPKPLHGREAILQLYRPLRRNMGENLTVHQLVIDSEAGLVVAALTNRLTAYGTVVLPGSTLESGDQLLLSGAIVYGLSNGRINLIRDVGR